MLAPFVKHLENDVVLLEQLRGIDQQSLTDAWLGAARLSDERGVLVYLAHETAPTPRTLQKGYT